VRRPEAEPDSAVGIIEAAHAVVLVRRCAHAVLLYAPTECDARSTDTKVAGI
jgi:hypothetical protein